jgi:hypothetical protein
MGGWDQNGPSGDWLGAGGVEWIHLAQDRGCWWALVDAVMNLRVLAPRSQSVVTEQFPVPCLFFENHEIHAFKFLLAWNTLHSGYKKDDKRLACMTKA